MGVGIVGLGHALPEKVLTNADLEKMVDTSDDWIVTRTGIRERRVAAYDQTTSDLAAQASIKAMESAKIKPESIDLVITGTTTSENMIPSVSCRVQQKIGAVNAVCFDLGAACAGFLFALETAKQYLQNDTYQTALVIGADKVSPFIDWKDRSTCILFGDAAGACIVKKIPGRGLIAAHLAGDGRHADLIEISAEQKRHVLKMKGSEVFKHAVKAMMNSSDIALEKSGLKIEDIVCIVPHQANMRIIDAITTRLKVNPSKVFVNLEKYGNTSAASIIVALSEAYEQKKFKQGDLILMTTFGSGFAWGSLVMEWSL